MISGKKRSPLDILNPHRKEIELLQYHYFLGECLEEVHWSSEAQEKFQQKVPDKKGKNALRIAAHAYQLYQARGFYNLLGNKSITANALYQMTEEDFQLLLIEARKIRAEELSKFLEGSFAGAQD
ncbi:hypothetical protein F8M41_000268 [Gigaspora margarita]|uniref:Uncharacterized protein n=1 Tax=Gigaspora margarita TaxID=4874 RepID=A0A8H4AZI8_GIGMA|nr:hypothetical protein F8M41_000268 [Gigaspora margarita]